MNHIKTVAVYAILLFVWSCSETPEERRESVFADPVIRDIYTLADRRDASGLKAYADHENAAYRTSFARVSGSVLAPELFEPLQKLMKDPIPYVRMYATFSVGQYRDTTALPALEKAIKKATIPEIKAEVLAAIGKSANKNAMEYLVFHEPSTAEEEAGKIWGIYYAMLRGYLQKDHLRTVTAHLKSREDETRLAAAHVLSRQNQFELDEQLPNLKDALESEKDGEIRTLLIRSMGKTKVDNKTLASYIEKDSDPRVRAEAISQLSKPLSEDQLNTLINALEDGAVWVAMAAAQKCYEVALPGEKLDEVKNLVLTSPIPEVRAAILIALLNASHTEAQSLWQRLSERYNGEIARAVLLKNLHRFTGSLDTLKACALKDSPIGSAAFEALANGAKNREDWERTYYDFSAKALKQGLLAQAYITANNIVSRSLNDTAKIPTAKLKAALLEFEHPAAVETKLELEKAIAAIENTRYKPASTTPENSIDWDLVQSISRKASATIYTDKGKLKLKLLVEDAPGSVSNFARLAGEKFYDGTAFHRVVPVFVSQGGGTRGDGFGSTPYTIRSEFSPLHFGTGVAGLASAGKDTEGCQFFFAHISTPHLNGRHTIFGSLTDDYQTLSEIQTATRIDSVRINF